MNEIDFESEIDVALTYGLINDYAAQKLLSMSKDDLDEDLWQKAIDNYREATAAGVNSDKDFSIYFYIDLFADDLLKDTFGTKLSLEERDSFKKFLFDNRDRLTLTSIESFKGAAKEWASEQEDLQKNAHPNTGRNIAPAPPYDLNKWAALFVQIQNLIRTGFKPEAAFARISNSLSIPERYKFLIWSKYNLRGEFLKYDINDQIRGRERSIRREGPSMKPKIASDGQYYYVPKLLQPTRPEQPNVPEFLASDSDYDEQYAVDFETARNKLMSRVFAIDKLLEKYRRVIKQEHLEAVEDALTELRKRIRKLRLASTMRDSIIKTANILKKLDFNAGAEELLSIAADPAGEPDAPAVSPEGSTKVVEREFQAVPPEQREEALDAAINRLTDISSVLKNRDLVRSLAEIDLMLHKLRMSSFFPEIQEAQSKLIDAFGYASNKIEDLVPKLRGGLQTQPDIVSPPTTPDVEPKSTEQKMLGDEVKELASDISKPPAKAPKAKPAQAPTPPPVAKEVLEDEGFEDEPVSLRAVPGIE